MEEKKKINPVIIILLILLIGLSTYVVYDKFFKTDIIKEKDNKEKTTTEEKVTYKDYQEEIGQEDEKYTLYYKFTTNDNYVSEISVNDLSSLLIDISDGYITIKYVVLKDGKIYYYFENGTYKEKYITRYSDLIDIDNNDNIKLNELNGLSGKVKRIKSVNLTSGFDVSQLLIMEDGSIYRLNFDNNAPTLSKIDELSKYKVDDIISWSTSFPAGYAYKVILTDGTILEKTIK